MVVRNVRSSNNNKPTHVRGEASRNPTPCLSSRPEGSRKFGRLDPAIPPKNANKISKIVAFSKDKSVLVLCSKGLIKKYKTEKLINVLDLKLRYDFRKRYDVYKTPTIFLLDSEKRILAKSIPLEDVKGFVEFHEKRLAAIK